MQGQRRVKHGAELPTQQLVEEEQLAVAVGKPHPLFRVIVEAFRATCWTREPQLLRRRLLVDYIRAVLAQTHIDHTRSVLHVPLAFLTAL